MNEPPTGKSSGWFVRPTFVGRAHWRCNAVAPPAHRRLGVRLPVPARAAAAPRLWTARQPAEASV